MSEIKLRKYIRNRIENLLEENQKRLNEEQKLRKLVRSIIKEAAIEDTPTKSTGVNKLVNALKVILPIIERAYKGLTTSPEQRESFKKHLMKAIIDTLLPEDAIDAADEPQLDEAVEPGDAPDESEIGINIDRKDDEDPFETEMDKEEREETEETEEAEKIEDIAGDEKLFPELPGLDETGRDEAVDVYKKVIDAIIRTYRRLHDSADKKDYKDYLVTNMLLYFDKWESDISGEIGDISTPEYEKQKQDSARYSRDTPEYYKQKQDLARYSDDTDLQESITKAILDAIKKSS